MCQNLPRTTETERKFMLSGSGFGDIAQLVEQMTFNHWVQGSSPCVPTRNKKPPQGGFFNSVDTGRRTRLSHDRGVGSTMSKRAKPLRRRFVRNAPSPVHRARESQCPHQEQETTARWFFNMQSYKTQEKQTATMGG